jgi:hypothetical protein
VTTCEFVAVPLLFVGFGSMTLEPTSAIFVKRPSTGAVTLTETLVAAPAASVPRFQVTRPAVSAPSPDAFTNVNPAGNASVATTPEAAEGPRFVITMV